VGYTRERIFKKVLFVSCNSDNLRSILKVQQGTLINRVIYRVKCFTQVSVNDVCLKMVFYSLYHI